MASGTTLAHSLWGSCSPNDCDWGEVGAETVTIGERTYVHAVIDHGFATRYVYADMSLYREGQLWIWMWTDFDDPNRPMRLDADVQPGAHALRRLQERPVFPVLDGKAYAMQADLEVKRDPSEGKPTALSEPRPGS